MSFARIGSFAGAALVALTGASAFAQTERVLDVDFNAMSFTTRTLQSGTDRQEGAVYLYTNVATVAGERVDARVTITDVVSATIGVLDGTTNALRFEPEIELTAANGYAEFRFEFVDASGDPVALTNFAATGVDIDGGTGFREFQEVGGFSSYAVDASTGLAVTSAGAGRLRFRGIAASLAGLAFDNSASYIAYFETPLPSLTFRMGATGDTNGADRLYSMNLGAPAGAFSNPVIVFAPSTTLATAAVDTRAPFTATITFSDGVSGVAESDLILSGCSVEAGSLITVSPTVYTVTVVPAADQPCTVLFPAGGATSLATTLYNTLSNELVLAVADLEPPDTSFVSVEPNPTNDTTGDFDFASDDPDATFECSVDGGEFVACADPYNTPGLANGSHTLAVRAVDASGNVDPTPASYAWTIDAAVPNTFIDVAEPSPTNDTTGDFEFSSNEALVTYECSVDSAPYVPCTEVWSTAELAEGEHSLRVRARDAATNPDPSPATHVWIIDLTAPDTLIDSAPAAESPPGAQSFEVSSTDPSATLECSIDGSAFVACTSETIYEDLVVGEHTFAVRSTDAAGNTDPTPAQYAWTIVAPVDDRDADGIPDDVDNCPDDPNTDQADTDDDTIGDVCDEPPADDRDSDGIPDDADNCPDDANPEQEDLDDDNLGDACDDDIDGDGLTNDSETDEHDTDPRNPDTDGGTIDDGVEVGRGTDPNDPTDDLPGVEDDPDRDGLTNDQEDELGTDPTDADSDDDGLCDGPTSVLDICNRGEDFDGNGVIDDGETDPNDADSDDDGLGDGEEINLETDPLDADTDDDDVLDGTELGVTTDDLGDDTDRDVFTPDADPTSTTDPLDADTDDGSVADGDEDFNGNGRIDTGETDPNVGSDDVETCVTDTDCDGDGLSDDEEEDLGTDPNDGDTDDGGVNDGDEVELGTDPLDAADDSEAPAADYVFEGGSSFGCASSPVNRVPLAGALAAVGLLALRRRRANSAA